VNLERLIKLDKLDKRIEEMYVQKQGNKEKRMQTGIYEYKK
jgi:hypothetical protein